MAGHFSGRCTLLDAYKYIIIAYSHFFHCEGPYPSSVFCINNEIPHLIQDMAPDSFHLFFDMRPPAELDHVEWALDLAVFNETIHFKKTIHLQY